MLLKVVLGSPSGFADRNVCLYTISRGAALAQQILKPL